MISTNFIGRLGNQIFQFAFLFGLHKAKGYDLFLKPNIDLLECFDLNYPILNLNLQIKREPHFHFDKKFPNNYNDNYLYNGYYQSEKYFEHCSNELKNVLKFRQEHIKNIPEKDLISIHVRRGDYVGNSVHPVISLEYINNAKEKFLNKKFLVFSDDINWCKKQNLGDYYAENKNHYIDLYQMTQCSGSIISNSSFSWWGAYLGMNKNVVAPKKWFDGSHKYTNTQDLYCKNWNIL